MCIELYKSGKGVIAIKKTWIHRYQFWGKSMNTSLPWTITIVKK